jgi:hypothetical protein
MREGNVNTFTTKLCGCSQLGAERGAAEAIAAVRAGGGEFVRYCPGGFEPDPDPLRSLNADGSVLRRAEFRHRALRPDRTILDSIRARGLPPNTPPTARLTFIRDGRTVWVHQDGLLEDQRLVDPLALGQLLLACELYPHLLPAYGWVDENGANLPDPQRGGVRPDDLRYVFWANVFGPGHVEYLGRDFLEAAPGWRLVDLPGGGLLYVVSESYLQWWHEDRADVRAYFQQRAPGVQLYRREEWEYG